jgi:hypothetical protein
MPSGLKMPYTPQTNYKQKAFLSVVTQELKQETGNNAREVILVI